MADANSQGLQSLAAEIGRAPLRSKLTVLLAVLAVVGVLGLAGTVASKPHYVLLYSGLGDAERVEVEKALAEAKVSYRASQPPGPYAIYVDQGAYDEAQIAVALAEALRASPSGIATGEGGASAIFMSSGERQQTMLKREWQETEHLLEQLDFVARATVTTSMPDSSPLRKKQPVTVSVALALKAPGALRAGEASTVAKLVRYRFGVPAENVLISDQNGNILFDPTEDRAGPDARTVLDQAAEYDRALAEKVNRTLEAAFGERMALVTVNSEWDHDQSTIVSESLDPETVTTSSEKRSTKTPVGSAGQAGGVPGTSSNLAPGDGFGTETAGIPELTGAGPVSEAMSETSDERTTFEAARTRTQTVHTAPKLERLSVSLVIDETLNNRREEIVQLVKAAVGFDESRQDLIGVSSTSFAVEEGEEAEEGEAVAAPSQPNPTVELLLTRGVEIVAALAFVLVLLKSLGGNKRKGKRKEAAGAPALEHGGRTETLSLEPDPAALARAQIDELVRSNPRRVGEILSRWASEEKAGAH